MHDVAPMVCRQWSEEAEVHFLNSTDCQWRAQPHRMIRNSYTLYEWSWTVGLLFYIGMKLSLSELKPNLCPWMLLFSQVSGSSSQVTHPCYHTGFNLTMTLADLYDSPCVTKPGSIDPGKPVTFTGSGDPERCQSLIHNIVNVTECPFSPDCGFNGVYQPPVNGEYFVSFIYLLINQLINKLN